MKIIGMLHCILGLVLAAAAQSLHVEAIRSTPRCLACPNPVVYVTITGVIGKKRYTIGEFARYGDMDAISFAGGQDYHVVNVTGEFVEVSGTDRRGKPRIEKLHVIKVTDMD